MTKHPRPLLMLYLAVVAVVMVAAAACIIGPKHDDPTGAPIPASDTGGYSLDTDLADTGVGSVDAATDTLGPGDTAPDAAAGDGCGDAARDADADADAACGDAIADAPKDGG